MDEAYGRIAELGIAGAVLAVVLWAAIRFVWWNSKRADEVMREKDNYIAEINERRVETATEAIKAINEISTQLKQVLEILKGGH